MNDGSVEFEKLVAELEADPACRDEIIEARKWVARSFYKPGSEHYERLMRGEGPPSTVSEVRK